MFEWIKKRIKLIIVAIFLCIIGVPCIIHILFKIYPGNDFFVAEWSAGELLSYYGSILSFLGTVILGALSLYQNYIIKQEADKRTELLEQREYEKNMPKFKLEVLCRNGHNMNLRVALRNISENIANEIVVYNIQMLDANNDVIWCSDKKFSYAYLSESKEQMMELNNPTVLSTDIILSMEMKSMDKYSQWHSYLIKGVLENLNDTFKFKITEV